MKHFIWTALIIFPCSLWAQGDNFKTRSGKPADKETCIFEINLVDIQQKESVNEVSKPQIKNLTDYIKACGQSFSFRADYADREFKISIPKYLTDVTYELGNQKFAIVISDSSRDRTIGFFYDLDDSYKNHFLTKDSLGFWKLGTVGINGQRIYRFINWDKRNAGTIFTSNHLHLSYFTKNKEYEAELQQAISKFQW